MNRRDFLKNLGIVSIPLLVAPKLIFDYGANKHRYPTEWQVYEPIIIGQSYKQGDLYVYKSMYKVEGRFVTCQMQLMQNGHYLSLDYPVGNQRIFFAGKELSISNNGNVITCYEQA